MKTDGRYYRTLLSNAENGHVAVVKLLLEKVDVNAKSQDGRTPLSNAA
jgi:ankyrin repeat protein